MSDSKQLEHTRIKEIVVEEAKIWKNALEENDIKSLIDRVTHSVRWLIFLEVNNQQLPVRVSTWIRQYCVQVISNKTPEFLETDYMRDPINLISIPGSRCHTPRKK